MRLSIKLVHFLANMVTRCICLANVSQVTLGQQKAITIM